MKDEETLEKICEAFLSGKRREICGEHPDMTSLVRIAFGELDEESVREEVVSHLSTCADCLARLRGILEASQEEMTDAIGTQKAWKKFERYLELKQTPTWSRVSFLRKLSAAAAAAVLVLVAVVVYQFLHSRDHDIYLSDTMTFVSMTRGHNSIHPTSEGAYELAFRLPAALRAASRITVKITSEAAEEEAPVFFKGLEVKEDMEFLFLRIAPKTLAPGRYILQASAEGDETPAFLTTIELLPSP